MMSVNILTKPLEFKVIIHVVRLLNYLNSVFVLIDGASLNVLLLLSVVCSVTLMKQGRHRDGCDVVRQVHRKIQGKNRQGCCE